MTLRGEPADGKMTEMSFDVIAHTDLTADDVARLRQLFDAEYLQDFGEWDLDLPYGYAPHDFHIVARQKGEIVGHVGWARRDIRVGDHEIVVAGGIAFGYLGCREEVVSFYTACGWTRIYAAERSIDRSGSPNDDPPGPPLLTLPVEREVASWPVGTVDLRGRAW